MNTRGDHGLVSGLIVAVARAGDEASDLAGRRERIVESIARLTRAEFAYWVWGRGHHPRESISPVAIVPFGFDRERLARFVELGLDAATMAPWRGRFHRAMGAANAATRSRTDLYSDAEWDADPFARGLRGLEMDEWVVAVNYWADDTWSSVFVSRRRPAAPFSEAERDLIALAIGSIPWLQATAREALPPERFQGMTSRQRSVLLLLLDGLPRKAIAARLGIAEETVGAHIKAVYRHFGVGSVTELAALFLRNL